MTKESCQQIIPSKKKYHYVYYHLIRLFFIVGYLSITTFNSSLGNNYAKINTKIDTSYVDNLNDSAVNLLNSNPAFAKNILQQTIAKSKAIDYTRGKAISYNYLGILSYQNGDFDSSAYYFNLSLDLWKELNDSKRVAGLYGNISTVYAELGDIPEAIKTNKQSIELKWRFNDTISIANGYNNLSLLYKEIGDFNEALILQKKSFSLREAVDDSSRFITNYGNMAELYNLLGKVDSALLLVSTSVKLLQSENNKWNLANAYGILSKAYYLNGILDSALIYVDKSLIISKELGINDLLEEMIILQSEIYIALKQFENALRNIEGKKTYLNKTLEVYSLKLLAQIYFDQGLYKKAANYSKGYLEKSAVLEKAKIDNNIADLTADHIYELRELEIKNEQKVKKYELEQAVRSEQKKSSQLYLVILLTLIFIVMSIWLAVLINRKRNLLKKQNSEIEKLRDSQVEMIQLKTDELSSTREILSRYAFINTNELKAPLVKILDVIQLSDNNSIDEEDFINTIKIGAQELEEVIRKMSTELNKN